MHSMNSGSMKYRRRDFSARIRVREPGVRVLSHGRCVTCIGDGHDHVIGRASHVDVDLHDVHAAARAVNDRVFNQRQQDQRGHLCR